MNIIRLGTACLLLVLVAGCTISWERIGQPLNYKQLNALQRSETKREILEQVGPPEDVGRRLHGSIFIYRVRQQDMEDLNISLFQATFDFQTIDRKTDRLIVLFDKAGKKTAVAFDPGIVKARPE